MVGLIHRLAIVTPAVIADADDYNQPIPGAPVTRIVDGLLQPRTAREALQANQAGPMVADHLVFLAPGDEPVGAAYIRFEPDDGNRYEITGIRPFRFGALAHVEVDCRLVLTPVPETVSS